MKSRAISSEAQKWERSTTIRREYSQATGSGGHGDVMIWSALHGNMQRFERTGTEAASRFEHKVKRAGFKYGIGRELYNSPFIWIPADMCNIVQRGNSFTCYDRFKVAKMAVSEDENGVRRISGIRIVNEKSGKIVFSWKEG